MLINRLLVACGRRHFETRQRPRSPECWRQLSVSGWPEVWRAREQRIIPELNSIIYLKLRHEWYTTISVWARRNLTRGKWFKLAHKLMLKRNYNPRQSRERPYDVRAFQFLLPTFESLFRNGCPPVIWIISLYL